MEGIRTNSFLVRGSRGRASFGRIHAANFFLGNVSIFHEGVAVSPEVAGNGGEGDGGCLALDADTGGQMRVGGSVQLDGHHRQSGNGRNRNRRGGRDGYGVVVVGGQIQREIRRARWRPRRGWRKKDSLREGLRLMRILRFHAGLLRRRRAQTSQRHRRGRVRVAQGHGKRKRNARLLLGSG